MKVIKICMGSSCFARANRENLSMIEDYIKSHGLEGFVRLEGSLCLGECGKGPNMVIDGVFYHNVQPENIVQLLDENL